MSERHVSFHGAFKCFWTISCILSLFYCKVICLSFQINTWSFLKQAGNCMMVLKLDHLMTIRKNAELWIEVLHLQLGNIPGHRQHNNFVILFPVQIFYMKIRQVNQLSLFWNMSSHGNFTRMKSFTVSYSRNCFIVSKGDLLLFNSMVFGKNMKRTNLTWRNNNSAPINGYYSRIPLMDIQKCNFGVRWEHYRKGNFLLFILCSQN